MINLDNKCITHKYTSKPQMPFKKILYLVAFGNGENGEEEYNLSVHLILIVFNRSHCHHHHNLSFVLDLFSSLLLAPLLSLPLLLHLSRLPSWSHFSGETPGKSQSELSLLPETLSGVQSPPCLHPHSQLEETDTDTDTDRQTDMLSQKGLRNVSSIEMEGGQIQHLLSICCSMTSFPVRSSSCRSRKACPTSTHSSSSSIGSLTTVNFNL